MLQTYITIKVLQLVYTKSKRHGNNLMEWIIFVRLQELNNFNNIDDTISLNNQLQVMGFWEKFNTLFQPIIK